MTDTYRAGAEGKAKTEQLIRTLYSLLEDLLFLKSGTPELVRNQDIQAELARMAVAGRVCLDRHRDAAAGRGGERHAPESAAFARARHALRPRWSGNCRVD